MQCSSHCVHPDMPQQGKTPLSPPVREKVQLQKHLHWRCIWAPTPRPLQVQQIPLYHCRCAAHVRGSKHIHPTRAPCHRLHPPYTKLRHLDHTDSTACSHFPQCNASIACAGGKKAQHLQESRCTRGDISLRSKDCALSSHAVRSQLSISSSAYAEACACLLRLLCCHARADLEARHNDAQLSV